MHFSGFNTDLARERQDDAALQDRMVAEDNGNPPQRVAPATAAEQAEISRLIFSGEIYRKDETMIATAEAGIRSKIETGLAELEAMGLEDHEIQTFSLGLCLHTATVTLGAMRRLFGGREVERTSSLYVVRENGWSLYAPAPEAPVVLERL